MTGAHGTISSQSVDDGHANYDSLDQVSDKPSQKPLLINTIWQATYFYT